MRNARGGVQVKNESEILTERQQQAWTMRQQGLTYKRIAEAMDITSSAAGQLVHNAERRFREYEKYQRIEARNQEIIQLELTRGEVKLLLHLLKSALPRGAIWFAKKQRAIGESAWEMNFSWSLICAKSCRQCFMGN